LGDRRGDHESPRSTDVGRDHYSANDRGEPDRGQSWHQPLATTLLPPRQCQNGIDGLLGPIRNVGLVKRTSDPSSEIES
jgi:hypothetical protein